MEDDRDIRNFSGLCRLFPLPRVVQFPHSVLPLHIFEPRYRQMTEDALAGDKLVTIVQLRGPEGGRDATIGNPPVEIVGCLGRIIQHEKLPDGRFNFLLLGRRRVRLVHEVPTDKLYRTAEAEILDDLEDELPVEPRRDEIVGMFRQEFERHHFLDPDMARLLETELPLGVLTDIVAHALGLPSEIKQILLAEPRVGARAENLLSILRQIVARPQDMSANGKRFPPPFSAN